MVLLVGENGEIYGRMNIDQARMLAFQKGFDLIEVNPNAKIPVVKLADYGKIIYEQAKKQRKTRGRAGGIKEVRISYTISDHDLETKVKKAIGFFKDSNKVKLALILHGRENQFQKEAIAKMADFALRTGGEFEQTPARLGNRIIAVMVAKSHETKT